MSFKILSKLILIMLVYTFTVHSQDSIKNIKTQEKRMIEEWIETVSSWNARPTASDPHKICIDWIARQFESIGIIPNRDPHVFNRHAVSKNDVSFSIFSENNEKHLFLSSVYPFSGITGQNGVSGSLVYISGKKYSAAKGKIAVVEVPNKKIPASALFNIINEYPTGSTVLPSIIKNPVLSSTLFGPKLDEFKKAGALGVIAVWQNMSPGLATGQYVPFTLPYFSIPAAWASGDEGKEIVKAAKGNLQANFRLQGIVDTATAHTIWAVVEGEIKDETILIITHTDGTNPVEENGFIGLLDIANKLIKCGKKPHRTVVFVAVAGHLRLPDIIRKNKEQATTVWLNEHPEWCDGKKGHRKAVAGLVIEHLGAMEWTDAGTGYLPTGRPEIEIVYATSTVLQKITNRQWQRRTEPFRASIVTPRSIRHLGEGEPLFQARIPTVALLGIPSYLMSELSDQPPGVNRQQITEIVNSSLAQEQCLAMYNVLQELLIIPSHQFGEVKHVGFFGKISDIVKLVKVLRAKE